MPRETISRGTTPGGTTPGAGATTPEGTTPGAGDTTQGATTPRGATPGAGATTPCATTPGTTTPGTTTPGTTTPGATTPGATTPGATTPATPGATTPGATTPGATTPGAATASETLKAFAAKKSETYQNLKSSSQSLLSTAQSTLAAATAKRTTLTKELQQKNDERTKTLAELGKVSMPADAKPLVDKLENLIIEIRAIQGQLLDTTDEAGAAEAQVARARAQLERAGKNSAIAERELAEATAQSAKQTAWKAAFKTAPLSTLAQDASMVLASKDYADAKARVESDIPKALRIQAEKRVDREKAKINEAHTAVTKEEKALSELIEEGGLAGAAAKARAKFEIEQRQLRDRATLSLTQLESAVRLLKGIVAAPPLTDAAKKRIAEVAPAALGVIEARSDVEEKKEALEAAVAADKENSTPQTQEDVAKAQEALTKATEHFDTVNSESGNAARIWEATIPDAAWQRLQEFQEAKRILQDLAKMDLEKVATAFDAAERKLAAALEEAHDNELEIAKAGEELVTLQAALDRASNPARVFRALVSDS